MAQVSQVPPPPPRATGDDKEDLIAFLEWSRDFYESGVVAGYFLDSQSQLTETTIDPDNLPDPATATVASAQETANDAFLLATQAYAEATAGEWGSATVSETDTTFAVTFAQEQEDTDYFVIATSVALTGSPATGAHTVISVAKTTTGFTATVAAAPGAGTSVTFDWRIGRNGV